MYAQAQGTAEVKGLSLRTDPVLEQVHQLQRRAGLSAAADRRSLEHRHARRVRLLALATVALWLAALIVLLTRT
jgi:hypothetical protein